MVPEAASSSEVDKDDGEEAVKAEQGGAIGPALVPPVSHYLSPLLKVRRTRTYLRLPSWVGS